MTAPGAFIESAARESTPATISDVESTSHHILAMARADWEYEAAERLRAARGVHRLAGPDCADVLAALGLAGERG